jgi:pimeloyl-ACP methyl ester carboxylesterase
MKDRAGRVGSAGVGPLLRDLLGASPSIKSHLVGHSYGCKVVLSAIASAPPLAAGAVTSVLLLQPAVNFWCFAGNVAGEGFAGGYHRVAAAVKQPLLSTFSSHDFALRRTFHLVLTRRADLGEVKVAGLIEPDRYGALGGWGPRGCPPPLGQVVPMPAAGAAYPALAPGGPHVIALDGEHTIGSHGDVVTAHTAWALLQQVLAGSPAP